MRVHLYTSSFCGACDGARRVLDEAVALVPSATLVESNVAFRPDAAASARIESTPTVIVTTDAGAEVFRASGVPTLPQALAALARAV